MSVTDSSIPSTEYSDSIGGTKPVMITKCNASHIIA